ncbi:vesicle transport through interaction with t-SNAREs homolog 1A-like isoform X4 [Acanthaster planci]|uniref:Vesicle transport through interaction with t-SNAREs homolog 1A-like isoform X4 n=1 Tax=Acanthaster planci TaxID=133434 RepID=A0A8B7XFP7_ACAPL|nr:vesicle transport through interaction with t-SNAREs homolog 1A-like isoform X4 [Acanthaster planci]
MASAAMEEFEHQFASISAEITTKINKIPQLTGNEKKQLSSSAERQIDEARELLEQMDLEVRTIPSSDRQKYSTRLRSYEAELTRLEKDLRKAKIAFRDGDASREELLGIDDPRNSEDQRARLLDNTERLERSGKKLEAGYRMTIETVTRDRCWCWSKLTCPEWNDAIIQNRILMVFLAIVFLAIIIIIIYFMAKKK